MSRFGRKYLAGDHLRVLDLGSRALKNQTSYRPFFNRVGWEYIGADIEAGRNVDVVLQGPYTWQFGNEDFDAVVSGQTLEHVNYPWEFMVEVARVLKRGGFACIIAPASWHWHRYPVDTFRYYPDGMAALAKWAGLNVIRTGMDRLNERMKQTTYLIAQK